MSLGSEHPSPAANRAAPIPLPANRVVPMSLPAKLAALLKAVKPSYQTMLKKLSVGKCVSIEVVGDREEISLSQQDAAAKRSSLPAKPEHTGLQLVPGWSAARQVSVDSVDSNLASPDLVLVVRANGSNCPTVAEDLAASQLRQSLTSFAPSGISLASSSGTQAEPFPLPDMELPGPSPTKPHGKNKVRKVPLPGGYWCAVWHHPPRRKWVACVPDYATATVTANRSCLTAISTAVQSLASQVKIDQRKGVAALPLNKEEAVARFHSSMLEESGGLPLDIVLGAPSWIRVRPPQTPISRTELLLDLELAMATNAL